MNAWSLRAFRAAVVDAVFATITLVPSWFFAPHIVEKVAVFVGIWQPVFIMWVVGPIIEAKAQEATLRIIGLTAKIKSAVRELR